eukprot:TRINITY_DN58232_c0_g1_i1.p1 TRINITY_DN58232_c0_g1~~TRINITY_DN58232_c0_g1_i1.p1  ORF type:complete len:200 (-),score=64.86 TRINITY_DN58232_c0_g1_i1:81-626(-)
MDKLKKMGSVGLSAASAAKDGAKAAASVAAAEAMKNEKVAAAVDAHGSKIKDASEFVLSAVSNVFLPPAVKEFLSNPTQEALIANPELLFQFIGLLSALRHPKAALIQGLVVEGVSRAAQSEFAEAAQQKVAAGMVNTTVQQATGGAVGSVPPEVSSAAVSWAKQNPAEVMQLLKLAGSLK